MHEIGGNDVRTSGETNTAGDGEVEDSSGVESSNEISAGMDLGHAHEIQHGLNETSPDITPQEQAEAIHQNALTSILEENADYLSPLDQARIGRGLDGLQVHPNPDGNVTGSYQFQNGKSCIQVACLDQKQLERSTIHETIHFASYNREIIVIQPEKEGHMVYNTVGIRQASWFKSDRTGEIFNYTEQGRGLNEGLTTLYTNRKLAKISAERALEAQQKQIYGHAVDLCEALEEQVGETPLKEAFFGGRSAHWKTL